MLLRHPRQSLGDGTRRGEVGGLHGAGRLGDFRFKPPAPGPGFRGRCCCGGSRLTAIKSRGDRLLLLTATTAGPGGTGVIPPADPLLRVHALFA